MSRFRRAATRKEGDSIMASAQEVPNQERRPSLWDLRQIQRAVTELRASNPDSALADLVEERIRALEAVSPAPGSSRSSVSERSRVGK